MKNLPNIAKSEYRKGEYIGYCDMGILHIYKANTSYGNWAASFRNDDRRNVSIFAHTLTEMSEKIKGFNFAPFLK